jgi:energy-coupling factor transport system permease protein
VSFLPAPLEPVRPALLTRAAPVTLIVAGAVWLVAVVVASGPATPLILAAAASLAIVLISGLPLRLVPRRLAPLGLAALGLGVLTVLVYPGNSDLSAAAVVQLGPLRITGPAVVAGVSIALRLTVIALVSILVFATTDPTRLTDSLVQQWHVSHRFAYGSLAALRILPLLFADWTAIASVRRLRGIKAAGPLARVGAFGGQLFVLLVAAIRRADRMALAMDARGFDAGVRRGIYRPIALGPTDALVLVGGVAIALGALWVGRT